MSQIITYDMLDGLNENYQVIFNALHPEGLSLTDIEERAKKRNYYRIIYQYITEVLNGQHRMEP